MTEKEKAEIEKIKAETISITSQRVFEIIKSILLALSAIILFIFIQRPDSVLNKQISQETISRERAKLLIDLLKDNNPQKMLTGISIIKASYPNSDNMWINEIEKKFEIKTFQIDSLIRKIEKLSIEVNNIKDSLKITSSGHGRIENEHLRLALLRLQLDDVIGEI
ncbi:MAG: hypothetical protein NTW29_12545 [Bacteroidetes bacterium]|nr:hypothetical protein [Bacteroidota bacterium]